jgi:hypothetical protein
MPQIRWIPRFVRLPFKRSLSALGAEADDLKVMPLDFEPGLNRDQN